MPYQLCRVSGRKRGQFTPQWGKPTPKEGNMGRFFALTVAALMGLGLLSMSLAQAQDAYGGIHF